jgi:superfamily II DNA/RNA helicase
MIQELADTIWKSSRFRRTAKAIERMWLSQELKLENSDPVSEEIAARAMSAAAILACSDNLDHRIGALRLSTYIFEAFENSNFAFDAALRVVLARLKNFPAIETRKSVAEALPTLPWSLVVEEVSESGRHTVRLGGLTRLLTGFQHGLWQSLKEGASIALSAPTSVGKSFVLEFYLASLFENNARVVVYVVPTRALITQVSRDLVAIFKAAGQAAPEIVTVPARPESKPELNAIYVMTQERLHLTLQSSRDFRADLLVVDEAHSISEGARGILLQSVIDEVLVRSPKVQILFASPITKNLEAFGRLFQRADITERYSKEPTVSQNFLIAKRCEAGTISLTSIRETGHATTLGEVPMQLSLRTRAEKLAHIPLSLCHGQPNLIYANGPDEAEDVALVLSKQLKIPNPSNRQLELARLARESVHSKYVLADCVLNGVGFHYANIPTNLRQAVETAFAEGELKYLVCTSTLLQGVNLPAKNIFMFKPTRGQNKPLEPSDFWNLAGRAGRLRREFQGNIFLIDYDDWPSKPVRAPKDIEIAPAIENSIKLSAPGLGNIIQGKGVAASKSKKIELESAFVRLFTDLKTNRLADTLSRLQLDSEESADITRRLKEAESSISLPPDLLRRTHNVSVHKQQKLFERIKEALAREEAIIPLMPRDPQSFNSYAGILKLCHEIILGIDTSKNLHRFHAFLARKWMLGYSLPRIISEGLRKQREKGKTPDTRQYIRTTLDVIEEAIRFQTIRLFGCYKTLLEHALSESDMPLRPKIPDVELFLEIGASNETMVSLISLGLTRAVAIKLNGARDELDPELGIEETLKWLQSQAPAFALVRLSDLQREEVNSLLDNLRPKRQP